MVRGIALLQSDSCVMQGSLPQDEGELPQNPKRIPLTQKQGRVGALEGEEGEGVEASRLAEVEGPPVAKKSTQWVWRKKGRRHPLEIPRNFGEEESDEDEGQGGPPSHF